MINAATKKHTIIFSLRLSYIGLRTILRNSTMEHEPSNSSSILLFHRRNARLSVNRISIICLKNVKLFAQAKSRLTQSARIIAFNSQTNIAHYGYFALKFRHRCVYKILWWDAYTDIEKNPGSDKVLLSRRPQGFWGTFQFTLCQTVRNFKATASEKLFASPTLSFVVPKARQTWESKYPTISLRFPPSSSEFGIQLRDERKIASNVVL